MINPHKQEASLDKINNCYSNIHKPDSYSSSSIGGQFRLDGCPAGYFKDFKTGVSQTWKSTGSFRISYSSIQRIQETKRQREAEIIQKHTEAAKEANHIWNQSKPIARKAGHQYLVTKQIQQHNARIHDESLIIPIYNESGRLVNVQFINRQGNKRFLTGGRKQGCFHIIGNFSEHILICEGFATGASLYENCGQCVVVALDAGNLLPVANNIRELLPNTGIIICGDNDKSGVGQDKAAQAALAIGGKVFIPPVPGQDWNDYLTRGRQHG